MKRLKPRLNPENKHKRKKNEPNQEKKINPSEYLQMNCEFKSTLINQFKSIFGNV